MLSRTLCLFWCAFTAADGPLSYGLLRPDRLNWGFDGLGAGEGQPASVADKVESVSANRPDPDQPLFSDAVVEGVKNGDSDAVGEVYVRLADRLLGYLTARVHDRAMAEDLLEATFIELLQKGHTIRGGAASIKVWLFRAAHYNALDYLRKIKRRGEWLEADLTLFDQPEGTRGPADRAEADDTASRVRAAMATLSGEQRQVLLLRYVAGLTAAEVADVMSKSDGAVRALQHRGERSLGRVLDHFGVPPSAENPASSVGIDASSLHQPRPQDSTR